MSITKIIELYCVLVNIIKYLSAYIYLYILYNLHSLSHVL